MKKLSLAVAAGALAAPTIMNIEANLSFCRRCVFAAAVAVFFSASAGVEELEALDREIAAFRAECEREGKTLGAPNEKGEFVLFPEGQKIEAMEEKRRALAKKLGIATEAGDCSSWGLKPLGEPGEIVCPTEFTNHPSLGPAPVRKPGLRLFGRDVAATICVGRGHADFKYVRSLAEELKYHLETMTGRSVEISKFLPRKGPAILFETLSGDRERAVVRVENNVLHIAGVGPGLGHATTYVLEALGCRYLWPGEAGKVIPKMGEVVFPDVELDFTPALTVRGIRTYALRQGSRLWNSLVKIGFDPLQFEKLCAAAQTDHPGNRGFFQWHGVNDTESASGYCSSNSLYRWGHSFGDYKERFGESHPEWFALQPDGTRRPRDDRPTFCMSNEALLDQAAADIIEQFRREPEVVALSVCLPDGGYSSPCMCEKCRRLDPVNAPEVPLGVFRPKRTKYPYVSRTDRTLWFSNRIIERVHKVFPGKKLTFYAYASYKLPPVKERPDPDLVILSVAGADYAKASTRYAAQHDVAAWSSFGNRILWRPNVFWGFFSYTPQNQARQCFEDLELFKVNGVVGTDFDCMDGRWAEKGLMYYMCAKAHLNPDHLDYETIYGDYCEKGFGPASGEIRLYFDELEAYGLSCAAKEVTDSEYRAGFDYAAFYAILDSADAKAAGMEEVLRRIAVLRTGLEYSKRIADIMELYRKRNYKGKDADMKAAQRDFIEYVHRKSREPDSLIAYNPSGFGFYLPALKTWKGSDENNR